MAVERYGRMCDHNRETGYDNTDIYRFASGKYVLATDYDDLLRLKDELQEALKLMQAEVGASGNWMAKDFGWKKACGACADVLQKAGAFNAS